MTVDEALKRYENVSIAVREDYREKCNTLNLMPEKEIMIAKGERDGEEEKYLVIIFRDAYRRIAQEQESFGSCYALPIYEGDDVTISPGASMSNSIEIVHKLGLQPRKNLVGAYGILFKKNTPPVLQMVNLAEFSTNKGFWDPIYGMPSLMICKVAEVQVLRSGYARLFSGTYSEDEIRGAREEIDKGKLIKFCQTNAKLIKDDINKDIAECSIGELQELARIIRERK